MVEKIYALILVDRFHRVTEGLIDDEQKGFKAWKGRVGQIFTLKQIGEETLEYVGFMDLEVYDRVNREALWQVLRMYDVGIKLLSGIKIMYIDSLACVKVKRGVRVSCLGYIVGCVMVPWFFNVEEPRWLSG